MDTTRFAKFRIGDIVKHRFFPFRGVIFDVDPVFADSDVSYETVQLIEGRQRRDQPFYYLFAENDQTPYIAYVSEQNLFADSSGGPVSHPQLDDMFERDANGNYRWRTARMN